MDRLISVIIPVYQVAPWIGQCITSFKEQKLRDLEFIFIDDCSTDGSKEIIEEFAAEDPRVVIIYNQTNLGPGPSRNKGIDVAKGQYLSFVDPDDYLADAFYQKLYQEAIRTKSDIVKGSRVKFGDRIFSSQKCNLDIARTLRQNKPLWTAFTYEHQTAIYRRSLFEDGNSRYGISRKSQDVTFLLRCTARASTISLVPTAVYYYRQRPNSATSLISIDRIENELISLEEWVDIFRKGSFNRIACHKYLWFWLGKVCNKLYYLNESQVIPQEEYRACLSSLVRIIKKIPECHMLLREHEELSVLVNEGYLIPRFTSPFDGNYFAAREWVSFLQGRTEVPDEYLYRCSYSVLCERIRSIKRFLKTGQRMEKTDLSKIDCKMRRKIRGYYLKAVVELAKRYSSSLGERLVLLFVLDPGKSHLKKVGGDE